MAQRAQRLLEIAGRGGLFAGRRRAGVEGGEERLVLLRADVT